MTTNLIETPRDIPLNGQTNINMDESSGFPFDDRDFDRDRSHSSFRSQLDDIAKRHPEFAEHLNLGGNFPFRSHTLGRRRRDSDKEKPSGSQDAEFRRYAHDRPFSRFDNLNFPFGQYFEDDVPDFYEARCRAPEQPQYTYTTRQTPGEEAQPQPQTSQPSSPQPTGTTEKPPQIPNFEGRKPNIQQSNTVDLGQKQEPVDENRGQRSMSAPPENRSTGQRFVSSINIPIQRPSGGGDMGAKASTQPQEPPQQQQTNKPNERVIPIHVEGRDEPIIPKNVNTTFTQPPPQPQPQTERIFGRNPSHFTQFLNKGEPQGMTPEEHYRQQQQQYQKQQQQNFQQQQQQQQNQNQDIPQSQPQPPSSKSMQLDQIQKIQKDVSELMNQVEKFNGKPKDKEYLYLDEMLTRNLIKLDNIETEGKDNIRQARKEAIKCIEGCIGILEAKANANLAAEAAKEEKKMEVEKTEEVNQQEQSSEKAPEQKEPVTEQPASLEVSGVTRTGSVANVTPMEVVEETKKEVPTETQSETAKVEEKETTVQKESEETKNEEVKGEEVKNTETNVENMEVSSTTTDANPSNVETTEAQEDKKEKKKGKKKEKTEKK